MSNNDLEVVVIINGTDVNPWAQFGLTRNPFPQLGVGELTRGEMQVASLDGDPVTSADDIRTRLAGFAPEFVRLCVDNWRRGHRVGFTVTFPRSRL